MSNSVASARSDFRARLRRGDLVLGALINVPSPDLVEVAGFAGFDVAFIDAEHGALSARDIQDMIRAADATGLASLVRVPDGTKEHVLRALDSGAAGIIFPQIGGARDAEAAVRATHYPPAGDRGAAFYARASRYTLDNGVDRLRAANEAVLTGVLIESRAGVEHVSEILQVPGVDFAVIGPTDLATDLGVDIRTDRTRIDDAIRTIADVGKRFAVPTAIAAVTPALGATYYSLGYRFLFMGVVPSLARAMAEYVVKFHEIDGARRSS